MKTWWPASLTPWSGRWDTISPDTHERKVWKERTKDLWDNKCKWLKRVLLKEKVMLLSEQYNMWTVFTCLTSSDYVLWLVQNHGMLKHALFLEIHCIRCKKFSSAGWTAWVTTYWLTVFQFLQMTGIFFMQTGGDGGGEDVKIMKYVIYCKNPQYVLTM